MDKRESAKKIFAELQETERARTCGYQAEQIYRKTHNYRFYKTIEICKRLISNSNVSVLDIGRSFLTKLLSEYYKNVSTLGLDINLDNGGQMEASTLNLKTPHITFDLNKSPNPDLWPEINQSFGLIVYAETIEHLPIAPEYSLIFLSSLLSEDGILLITTPNAAMIMKRLILLLKGKNPYGRIRLFAENPGHFREYTMDELITVGADCGLEAIHTEYVNFYESDNFMYSILKNLKPAMKDSLIIAFHKRTK